MDKVIKQTIDARKNAIYSSYKVSDKKMNEKIDDLFKRINEFGEKYKDVNEFEAEFAKSPLNNEYTNIFVELAKVDISASKPSTGEMVADRVVSEVKNRTGLTRAARANARDKAIRDIPIVGDIVDAKQKFDFFARFRKNK